MDKRSASPAQKWPSSTNTSPSPSRHHHARSSSSHTAISNVKTNQNVAAKAAAQRLAQVMASQNNPTYEQDSDSDDDDLVFASAPSTPLAFARSSLPGTPTGNKHTPFRWPSFSRNVAEDSAGGRSLSGRRMPVASVASTPARHASPTTVTASLQTAPSSLPSLDPPTIKPTEKRFLSTRGVFDTKVSREAMALQDERDLRQRVNESMLEKLRVEEEKCQEVEARVKELEKQVASVREEVSSEAKLLSRKEAMLRQREEALMNEIQTNDRMNAEVASLRSKVKEMRDMKTAAIDQLHGVENEVKALRSMTSRMVLTQKEMEDIVLKRCWLSRYWGLAVRHGICEDVAVSKHEHWSSLAPLPLEIVLSAGQRATVESSSNAGSESTQRSKLVQDCSDLSGEVNIESMLSVEIGMKELTSLKVEDAIVLALSQQRQLNTVQTSESETKPSGNQKLNEPIELGPGEAEDVLFKEAWLLYFWRRAQTVGIEEQLATERLNFWKDRRTHAPTSHDVVAVEEGLVELRKLEIERRLWTQSRK